MNVPRGGIWASVTCIIGSEGDPGTAPLSRRLLLSRHHRRRSRDELLLASSLMSSRYGSSSIFSLSARQGNPSRPPEPNLWPSPRESAPRAILRPESRRRCPSRSLEPDGALLAALDEPDARQALPSFSDTHSSRRHRRVGAADAAAAAPRSARISRRAARDVLPPSRQLSLQRRRGSSSRLRRSVEPRERNAYCSAR